jgi:hypothetical protein
VGFRSHDRDRPHQRQVIRGTARRGGGVHPHGGKCFRGMYPDAIEGKEWLPGRPAAHPGRLPEVGAKMPECARQEEPFVDVPQDYGEAARVAYNCLCQALHLESPFPWRQAQMGRDNAERSTVNRDVNVQSTPGLTRRHVQVNPPYRQDWQTREQRNAVVPARADKRRAGHHLELRHGGEKLDFIASIRAYTVRMEFLEPEDVSIDFADHPGNTGRVMLSVGANTTMDIVGCHDET